MGQGHFFELGTDFESKQLKWRRLNLLISERNIGKLELSVKY